MKPAPSLPSVEEALSLILGTGIRYPSELHSLSKTYGRTLAQDVRAERDSPPFDRVTMDGIAIAHAAWAAGRRRFHVRGAQAAGNVPLSLARPELDAIRVMTGAVLPAGADCVIPFEDFVVAGETVSVSDSATAAPGQNIHRKGSDQKKDEVLLRAGTRIRSNEIAVLASCGMATVEVSHAPSAAILCTGDELVDVGRPILPHQMRMSTHHALHAALVHLGAGRINLFHLADQFEPTRNTLAAIMEKHDLLLTVGGIASGDFDFVARALQELRIKPIVQKVAQRPGKPLWFGTHKRTAVFGLPGNPLSTMVCFHKYVRPFLETACGGAPTRPVPAVLGADVTSAAPLAFFPPVRVQHADNGQVTATPVPYNTSGNMAALAQTDGFVELSRDRDRFPAGSVVPLYLWI